VNTNLGWTWSGVTHPGRFIPFGGDIGFRNDAVRYDGTRGDVAYVAFDTMRLEPWAKSSLAQENGRDARCLEHGTDRRITWQQVCQVPVNLQPGTTYRFRITRLPVDTKGTPGTADDTQPWLAEIINTANGAVLLSAQLHSPANARLMTGLRNTATYSGRTLPCASVPAQTITFTRPGFNWNGATFGASTTVGTRTMTATPLCTAPTGTTLSGTPAKVRLVTAG
jgi:hypothetical protein